MYFEIATGIGAGIWHCIFGRREGQMKSRELGEKAGAMDYGSVAIALHRFGKKLKEHPPLGTAHQKIQKLIVKK